MEHSHEGHVAGRGAAGVDAAAADGAPAEELPDPGAEVLDRLVQIETERARLEAEQMRLMEELVGLRREEARGCAGGRRAGEIAAGFATDELAATLTWTVYRVQHRLANARRCRRDLPLLWRAWRAGRVDGFRADIVLEASRRLVDQRYVSELDAGAAPIAGTRTPGELRRWCERFIARVEPAALAERHEQAYTERRVQTRHEPDGMGSLWLFTRGVDMAAIDARLAALARGLGADDLRTMDQRRADLTTDLLLGRLRSCSGRRADDVTTAGVGGRASSASETDVVVVVPVAALLDGCDVSGQLVDGTPVPAGALTRILGRPGTLYHRLLTDRRGQIVDLTQLGRFPTAQLRLGVQVRDGTCTFPGCSTPAERCDQDHTVSHPDGPTCWCNLACLCRRHHRLKQHPRVHLRQLRPGLLEWTLPSGRSHLVRGDPVLDPLLDSTREQPHEPVHERAHGPPATPEGSEAGLLDLDPLIDEADVRALLPIGADVTALSRAQLDFVLAG